ncbi:MAG TPA: sensor domain-containing diguanylate cyclase [Micromonosporaceae bacterium]|nr:sensor domain-containing diguanylate cyclase [Micromonosporaceae bacterium]
MVDAAGVLQVQQLVELLAVVSSFPDQESAIRGAVERAAQALEAEVAAVIVGGQVAASIGYPASAAPDEDLIAAAERRSDHLVVPGVGHCATVGAGWGGPHPGHLLLARADPAGFSVEEINLVRGMARLLELTLRMLRTLETEHAMRERSDRQAAENAELLVSLQQRQRLLEHLFEIQRAISRRVPLDQILDRIINATSGLLGDDVIGLWLRDGAAEDRAKLAASAGLDPDAAKRLPAVLLIDAGLAGAAMLQDRLVVQQGAVASSVLDQLAAQPLRGSMAAPVHESGVVSGCLVVGSFAAQRRFGEAEQQMLRALAEHVSLALTDAHTVDRMHQAFHDSLTGLASRALFLDRLASGLADARRELTSTALLFVDLDRFKVVNDTLGHAVGDELLMVTADRLRGQLRTVDVAARLGGDEFAVMLTGVDGAQEAILVADRIVAVLAQPMVIAGRRLPMCASVGIAICESGELDPAELMRRADVAMYQAKRGGRGRHRLYTDRMEEAFATGLVS